MPPVRLEPSRGDDPESEYEHEEEGPAGPTAARPVLEHVTDATFVEAAPGVLVFIRPGAAIPHGLAGLPRRAAVWDEHGKCWTPQPQSEPAGPAEPAKGKRGRRK